MCSFLPYNEVMSLAGVLLWQPGVDTLLAVSHWGHEHDSW